MSNDMEFGCSTRYESISSVIHSLSLSPLSHNVLCVYNSSVVIIFAPYSRTFNRHFAHYLNRPFRNKIKPKKPIHIYSNCLQTKFISHFWHPGTLRIHSLISQPVAIGTIKTNDAFPYCDAFPAFVCVCVCAACV